MYLGIEFICQNDLRLADVLQRWYLI